MKRLNSFAVVLVLTVGAFFFGNANRCVAGQSEYYSRGGDGVLRMKHSPVLGFNIPIDVWIDGMHSGAFTKGHVFERSLAPGRHNLYASRPGQLYSSFYGTLDVRPGETYSFVVKSTPNQVYLVPVSRID
ncbi:MAG TPA: hypothetical protein VF751_02235 [Chthoniobacterales bacterium]